ncbi:MAG: pyridoxal phosphate-dependent aminotransferase [Myxococcota bacterium]
MPPPVPSLRGQQAPASPIRRLAPHADFARQRGVHVHHLNIGQPDIPTPRAVLDAYRTFQEPVLAYGVSEGSLGYRKALADYYNGLGAAAGGAPIAPSQILVTVGGSEALQFGIAATCDPGDEVLVPEPFYPNYKGFAHLLGVNVRPIPTHASEGFHLSLDRVREAIGPRTRAVLLSTPGNPTGAMLTAQELADLGKLCVERGLYFMCDEVYRDFVYDGGAKVAPSVLAQPGLDDVAFMVDSVSKRYSACGARVGCMVTRNPQIYAACLKFAQARLSPPVVDQLAAWAALATPEAELRSAIDEYRRRRDVLVQGLQHIPGVTVRSPAGAFYLMAGLPVANAEEFCIFMLREFDLGGETVMLAPGDGFYETPGAGSHQVRAAYVLETAKLERSVAIIQAGLHAFAQRKAQS